MAQKHGRDALGSERRLKAKDNGKIYATMKDVQKHGNIGSLHCYMRQGLDGSQHPILPSLLEAARA